MLKIPLTIHFSISCGEPINFISMDSSTNTPMGLFPFIEGIVARKRQSTN